MCEKTAEMYAIFDFFESETIDVGLVRNIQLDEKSSELDLVKIKAEEVIVNVLWGKKSGKKGSSKVKPVVYAAKILNFNGNRSHMAILFISVL